MVAPFIYNNNIKLQQLNRSQIQNTERKKRKRKIYAITNCPNFSSFYLLHNALWRQTKHSLNERKKGLTSFSVALCECTNIFLTNYPSRLHLYTSGMSLFSSFFLFCSVLFIAQNEEFVLFFFFFAFDLCTFNRAPYHVLLHDKSEFFVMIAFVIF